MVSSIISAIVNDPRFAEAIQAKIGMAVNTDNLEKEHDALCTQFRQAVGTKSRLEQQMDAPDELYQLSTEMELKEFLRAFIEKIEIYPEKHKGGCWVRKIVFNFPASVNCEDVVEYSLEFLTNVECVVLLSKHI